MADARVTAALGAAALVATSACSRPAASVQTFAAPPRSAAAAFVDDTAPLPRYHSSRLAASIPLPAGRTWRIDDHSRPELVAIHPPTGSAVTLAVFRAEELVGRRQCEALARARKLVPGGDLRTLEDDATYTQQTFDTRVWVAVEPGGRPDRKLAGYVMAFGGFLRKCFAFVFSTQVESASDEPVLSARLAFARARILGGLELDAFDTVTRADPVGPGAAPAVP